MKKLFLTVLIAGLSALGYAQDGSRNALGLRLGGNDGYGTEISYQRYLHDNNRLELDLGWRNSNHYDAFKVAGLYQWIWNIEGGFNWYAGVGGGLGSYSYENGYDHGDSDGFFAFAAGDLGIEYNFDFPLQLSLDFRPEIYFNEFHGDHFGPDLALGIRYKF